MGAGFSEGKEKMKKSNFLAIFAEGQLRAFYDY